MPGGRVFARDVARVPETHHCGVQPRQRRRAQLQGVLPAGVLQHLPHFQGQKGVEAPQPELLPWDQGLAGRLAAARAVSARFQGSATVPARCLPVRPGPEPRHGIGDIIVVATARQIFQLAQPGGRAPVPPLCPGRRPEDDGPAADFGSDGNAVEGGLVVEQLVVQVRGKGGLERPEGQQAPAIPLLMAP